MGEIQRSQKDVEIFQFLLFSFLILGFLSFFLALTGYFYKEIIVSSLPAIFLAAFFYLKAKGIKLSYSGEFSAIAIFSIIFVAGLSFFSTPTVFSGRDQGSLSEAAIRLSQNHELSFSTPASHEFFKIYGPGKALNFPGFYYTKNGNLITQFPLPYIAWLSIFYSFFGLSGLTIANAVLSAVFLLSFYFSLRLFLKAAPSGFAIAIAATSFLFFWFSKYTLSENMALALLWISILELLLFVKSQRALYFYAILLSSSLLFFARIEGIAFFVVIWAILLTVSRTRKFITEKKWLTIIFFALSVMILSTYFLIAVPFYKEITKGILFSGSPSPSSNILKIYLMYGIFQFLVLGAAGIYYLFRKKEHFALIPFFVALPSFLYLIDPHISSDHPWMLRRFLFSILPALIFYSTLMLNYWLYKGKKSIFYAVALFLILANIPLFAKYAFFSENKNLLAQTENLSENFGSGDLILVDRLASGDGWAMLTGPMNFLYGKQAVYFFNPDNFGKIDKNKFGRIYLIVPDENINFYQKSILGERIKYYKDYSIKTGRLYIAGENTGSLIKLPDKKTVEIKGKIFEILK